MNYTKKSVKQIKKLPKNIVIALRTLDIEMQIKGPWRNNWKNFSKLALDKYHCHLKKGHPTYVVCWEIISKKNKIMEVYYVGTHEKAKY